MLLFYVKADLNDVERGEANGAVYDGRRVHLAQCNCKRILAGDFRAAGAYMRRCGRIAAGLESEHERQISRRTQLRASTRLLWSGAAGRVAALHAGFGAGR